MLILLGGIGGGSMANTDEAGFGLEPFDASAGGGEVSAPPPTPAPLEVLNVAGAVCAVGGAAAPAGAAAAAPLLAPSSSITYPMMSFCNKTNRVKKESVNAKSRKERKKKTLSYQSSCSTSLPPSPPPSHPQNYIPPPTHPNSPTDGAY